jgi:hypothetical protein
MDKTKAEEARRQIELQKMNWEANIKKLNDEKERKEREKKRIAEEKKKEEMKRRLEEAQIRNRKILEEEQKLWKSNKGELQDTGRSDMLGMETDVNVSMS